MSNSMKFDEYITCPGDTILDLLEANNMTQIDLASKLGITKKNVNEIIKGKAPLTAKNALKLEYIFNIPASFWNNLEKEYRESLERKKDLDTIINEIPYLKSIPYNEMANRNWDFIEKTTSPIEKVKNLRKFFSCASLTFDTELYKKINFRKKDNISFNEKALYCFLRYGEIESNKIKGPNFNILNLKKKIREIRALANKPFFDNYDKIKETLLSCGVFLIYEPHLSCTYLKGVTYKPNSKRAIIMISTKGKKDDIVWFTLFHEIAHLLKHSKKEMFIDINTLEKEQKELEANTFAKNILINEKKYQSFIKSNSSYNKENIIKFAKENNVLPGIVVGRLQNDKVISWNEFNDLIIKI